MARHKPRAPSNAASRDRASKPSRADPKSSSASTVGGGTQPPSSAHRDVEPGSLAEALSTQRIAGAELVDAIPRNENKPLEYGEVAIEPAEGEHACAADSIATASTVTEGVGSPKVGAGATAAGVNMNDGSLDRVRADSGGRVLTTNQGVPVGDNQHSLRAGLRGPTLMEDFILREKITHFDHERIPERIVHARGSGAHGVFECYESLERYTRASIFSAAGKRTPTFARFSTVMGERGSADTVRDVRGFAVKFYTDEGNWDLVGNNIPVFFIQDAIKFPDLVHAGKPEPHCGMPQAATAHDTFWDFVSLMPESTHMLMWAMSDRAIPRSYRTMQGFGVHTFRLVNERGESHFVKFHWTPLAGTYSLVWDEAVRIAGADPDFHRRDLWEAIESGNFPEYELGMQIFTEEEAARWSFDVLDATKLVPEELCAVRPVGKMALNRNPDNFFAETEQVAFCTAHIVPGLDFSNDPLLAGRNHSYIDTQISRLSGPNFHEIPINSPIAPVHNNQRDGAHRQAIHRGRVSYEPNSLGGGCPFQAGLRGFNSVVRGEPAEGPNAGEASSPSQGVDGSRFSGTVAALEAGVGVDKVRGHPEKFAEHYAQARLFYESQSMEERRHIAAAFRFELARVQTVGVRRRMLAGLRNVDEELAREVGRGLGIVDLPDPLPLAIEAPMAAEIEHSPSLSLLAHPGKVGIAGRRVALLVGEGADADALDAIHTILIAGGATARIVASQLLPVTSCRQTAIAVDATIETMPADLFDGVALMLGKGVSSAAMLDAQVLDFLRRQYRHCKPMLIGGAGIDLLDAAGIPVELPDGEPDAGLVIAEGSIEAAITAFVAALAAHRNYAREADPPRV